MKQELSASALQIQEKAERMKAMLRLAESVTYGQIKDILEQNSTLTDKLVIEQVKELGIPKIPFLHEYIVVMHQTHVKLETAMGYYNHFSRRLHPTFIETKKAHFHLTEFQIKELIKEYREEVTSQK